MKWLVIPFLVILKGLFVFVLLNTKELFSNNDENNHIFFIFFPALFMLLGYILGFIDAYFRGGTDIQTHIQYFTYVEVSGSIGVLFGFIFLIRFLYKEYRRL